MPDWPSALDHVDWAVLSTTSLTIYEMLLMVDDEWAVVRRQWQKFNFTSSLYLLMRLMLVIHVMLAFLPVKIILGSSATRYVQGLLKPVTSKQSALYVFSCYWNWIAWQIPMLSGFVLTSAFSALRVFAISQRNLVLATVVFLLAASPVATNAFGLSHLELTFHGPGDCSVQYAVSPRLNFIGLRALYLAKF
ncbi:hypothetical protein PsYK624_054460 [Phanerochaete sordida]|uniref:DUF6533 domain-containing protein n=1 Tax=Phanerochaete sordida TaxID=48140 RepID=A0A9P3G536_9APHY|nr:hypothetical protein PsYK624_054460 [Phanerochaete sordida]